MTFEEAQAHEAIIKDLAIQLGRAMQKAACEGLEVTVECAPASKITGQKAPVILPTVRVRPSQLETTS